MPDAVAHLFQNALELQRRGDLAGAIAGYRSLLANAPPHEGAMVNLAVALRGQGDFAAALTLLERAVGVWPDSINAAYNLGNALRDADRPEDAVARYRSILLRKPDHSGAAVNLALILQNNGQVPAALQVYAEALRVQPDSAELYHNYGALVWRRGDNATAEHCFRRAVAIAPGYATAWVSLAQTLLALDKLDAAEAAYAKALALMPGNPASLAGQGQVHVSQGRLTEALACLDAALLARPDLLDAHMGRARALLLAGRLPEAWADYEWRWHRSAVRKPDFGKPEWDGRAAAGKRLLIYAEQGLGDTIQFSRFMAPLAALGATVILRCAGRVMPILQHVRGISQILPEDQPLPADLAFDAPVSIIDVARHLGVTLAKLCEIPTGYVRIPAAPRAARAAGSALRVGICWQGNPRHANDSRRSCPLSAMVRLAAVPGVQLVSLQAGDAADALARSHIAPLVHQVPQVKAGLLPAAQVMQQLDLVVSVDTAIAHLAGSMGLAVWTMLPFAPDWRWLLERADTPWYPSMRLFRQSAPGDWDGLVDAVAHALAQRAQGV
jgi:tetratricopeptide (TPR) repeat protein